MQLFKVSLFGIDNQGETHDKQEYFYSSRKLAVELLRELNMTSIENAHGMKPRMDWYLWLVEYTEKDGRFYHKDSSIYAYFLSNADGFVAKGERKCFENEYAIFEIV